MGKGRERKEGKVKIIKGIKKRGVERREGWGGGGEMKLVRRKR